MACIKTEDLELKLSAREYLDKMVQDFISGNKLDPTVQRDFIKAIENVTDSMQAQAINHIYEQILQAYTYQTGLKKGAILSSYNHVANNIRQYYKQMLQEHASRKS